MKRGNHSKSRGSKALVMILAVVLLMGVSIGGTIAWLTDKTDPVVNTFTVASLFDDAETDFTLWEHKAVDADEDGRYELMNTEEVTENSYEILPGVDIPKDPTVDIIGLQENGYLYIKVTDALPAGMTYSIDPANWEALDGYDGVWVYKGSYATNNIIEGPKTFTVGILQDNVVKVASNYSGNAANISLTFNAYMVQAVGNGANAVEAWANTYGGT